MLSDLEAPYGIYAVTGNVDLSFRSMASQAFEPAGVRVLDNEVVDIEVHGQQIQIVGLSAHGSVLGGLRWMEKLQQ